MTNAAVEQARTEALQQARKVITQYLATAEKWRYDRVVWAFAVMLGEIPEDTPEPEAQAATEHSATHFEWGVRNHEGHVGLHANERSARETYERQRDHVFPPQALIRRTVTTLYSEWQDVDGSEAP